MASLPPHSLPRVRAPARGCRIRSDRGSERTAEFDDPGPTRRALAHPPDTTCYSNAELGQSRARRSSPRIANRRTVVIHLGRGIPRFVNIPPNRQRRREPRLGPVARGRGSAPFCGRRDVSPPPAGGRPFRRTCSRAFDAYLRIRRRSRQKKSSYYEEHRITLF